LPGFRVPDARRIHFRARADLGHRYVPPVAAHIGRYQRIGINHDYSRAQAVACFGEGCLELSNRADMSAGRAETFRRLGEVHAQRYAMLGGLEEIVERLAAGCNLQTVDAAKSAI